MAKHWQFMFEQGVMQNQDYPYTGKDGACKHDPDNTVGKVKHWNKQVEYSKEGKKTMI